MKKKILAVILASAMMICCFSGCSLTTTDSEKDMAQSVAEVDISQSSDFQDGGDFFEYRDVIRPMSITKRELVAYFVNAGYSYISSGQSYADTFEALMDSLVNYRIILQYSMVYFFEQSKDADSEYHNVYSVEGYNEFVGNAEGEELTLKTLQYFLDNAAVDTLDPADAGDAEAYTRYDKAEYHLKQSINSAIDTQEENYIAMQEDTSSDDSSDAEEDRAVPDGAETANEDYYDPAYDIYTGLNYITACGSYEKVEGGTRTTRQKAYNAFIEMLSANDLIDTDTELANAYSADAGKGVQSLGYYRSEFITQLQSALSEKLSDSFESEAAAGITADYLSRRFNELFNTQKQTFDNDRSSFETALDSVSDSSFLLYAPGLEDEDASIDDARYGFVYNILIPFSTQQNYQLSAYQNDEGLTEEEYYAYRAALLNEVYATDRRESWFNGATDYSFNGVNSGLDYYRSAVEGGATSAYLFFENSLTKSAGEDPAYEKISKYYGYYPYNGRVEYDPSEGEYKLTPNKLSLTDFLTEMEGYMNWALGKAGVSASAAGLNGSVSFNNDTFNLTNGLTDTYMQGDLRNAKGEIDYSKFVYYVGQVGDIDFSANETFVEGTAAYTALSAFNELQFAYSTDTGCLNTYLGYSMILEDTDYMDEFEYAAKLAVSQGVGTYTVAPTDYGWHIVYCTYAFNSGDVYGDDVSWTGYMADGVIDEDLIPENSFEYFFYQAMKDSITGTYENVLQSKIINLYDTDACVTIHEERYSDYTSLQNNYSSGSSSQTGTTTTA